MSRITTCPHCATRLRVSEQITDKTLICPRCLAELDNPWPGTLIRATGFDTDVKHDMRVGSIVLAVLMGLCVLGIAIAFFVGLHGKRMGGERGLGASIFSLLLTTTAFGVLDVLVSIAIIREFIRSGASGARTLSARGVIGTAFLALGTIAAVVIFFGFMCGGLVVVLG